MISLWKFVCGWRYRQHHTHFDQTPATGLLRMSLLQQRVSVNSQDSTVSRQNGRMSFRLDASKTATICSDMVILNRCETSKTLRLHRTNWCLFQPFTDGSPERCRPGKGLHHPGPATHRQRAGTCHPSTCCASPLGKPHLTTL